MIPILPSHAWREFRGHPKAKGLNQTTHLATIADHTGKLHKCYVKLTPPDWPTPLTEALAWLLAEALDMPRPEFAAVLMAPVQKIKTHVPLDQHWLKHDEVIAFCASAVDGKNPMSGWRWLEKLRAKRLYGRKEVAKICAFDEWVENQDRHTGNLLVRKTGEHVAIDNELILYSLLWNVGLKFNHNSLLKESQQHLSLEHFKRFLVEVANSSKLHDGALSNASTGMHMTVNALVADPAVAAALWAKIHAFLSGRADKDWLPNRLGVIV